MLPEEQGLAAKKIMLLMQKCSKNLFLYPADHPQTRQSIEQLWQLIFAFLRSKPRLSLSFTTGEAFFDNDLLVEESLTCHSLISTCAAKQINSIAFMPGLTQNELMRFIKILNQDSIFEIDEFAQALNKAEIKNIEVKRLLYKKPDADLQSDSDEEVRNHKQRYKLAVNDLADVFEQFRKDESIRIEKVDGIIKWIVNNVAVGVSSLVALTTLRDHDEYTCRHSINVAILAIALGYKLGLDRERLSWLGTGALLHDIGKISIPEEIINKPGPLTADEWAIMKRHPIESARILAGLPTLELSALIVAFEHHIGYDGTGYPIRRKQIPTHPFSRIVQIADTYDGLTSKRSYHEGCLPTEALDYMLCKMPQAFDPVLLKLFVKSLGVYPVGTMVRLTNESLAMVVDENMNDLLRPKVKILDNAEKGRIMDLVASPISIKHAESADLRNLDADIAQPIM